ncbi:MAG: hypothetical protein P4L98_17025 [Ancalomicrobiaceae bacterium]|nr:hypothetical protein [Ancalomicrobiaceae bacterium]
MLVRFIASLVKLTVASLGVGVLLSLVHITHADVLAHLGLTPDQFVELIMRGVNWAIPKIGLGAFIVVPIWIVINVLRPPRHGD